MAWSLLRIIRGERGAPAPDVAELGDGTDRSYALLVSLAEGSGAVGAAYASTPYTNFGAATKGVVKAAPGNVKAIRFTNTNAAVRYAQLHNKATVPLATEVPLISIPIPAGSATVPGVASHEFSPSVYFSTGIGWAVSTTQGTFTDAATASEHSVLIEYI